ncbi:MAG: type II toxin-antitoxin system HicA family toxin [Candidatus Rokubacteria bacterium]|nr:type II toxin-antitoxin system HicA family toxin [Candidatus Rokubacteria bacterium]
MTPRLPQLSAHEVIRLLERNGFLLERQGGSHAIYRHPDGRRATVPVHGKRDLGRGLLRRILKDAGLSPEDI